MSAQHSDGDGVSSASAPNGDLKLVDVIAASKRRSGLLIVCAVLGVIAAGILTLLSRPVYEAEAKVLLEQQSGLPSSLSSLGAIPGFASLAGGSSVIAAEVERIRSRSLLRRVLAGPDATVLDDESLVTVVLDAAHASVWAGLKAKFGSAALAATNDEARLEAEVTDWGFPPKFQGLLELEFLSTDRVRIGFNRFLDSRAVEVQMEPGQPIDFEQASLVLWPRGDLAGRTFLVGAKTLRRAVDDLLDTLVIEEKSRGSNVLGLTYFGPSPKHASHLVNRLVDEFVRSRKDLSSTESDRTIDYIQGELRRIGRELAEAETQGVLWGQEMGPIALPETTQVLVESLSGIELEQARAIFAAASLEALLGSIEAGELSEDELLAIQAAQVVDGSDVEPLAVLVGEREALRARYNDEWPELKTTIAEIESRLVGIANTMQGQIDLERRTASGLARIAEGYEQELSKLPATQLAYARHERSIKTLGEIEIFFRGQLEDARLRLAATTPNAEVLDWAVEPLLRSRPSLRVNLMVGLLLGLGLGVVFGLLLELKRPIVSVGRLAEVCGAPVLGVLRRRLWQPWLPLRDRPDGRGADDLRALRLALLQRTRDVGGCKSLAIASTRRGEGRSRIAANLALALVATGERVLLVDGDTRRHNLSKRLGLSVSAQDEFGLGLESLATAVRSGGVDNLDVLSLGGEISLADQVDAGVGQKFLDQAKQSWDRIIFDTPAIADAADALAICRSVDGVVLVARAGRGGEDDVACTAASLERVGARLIGVVLNGR